jgi:peptidoglycan/LPS O-acetylase OafA/YrhL
MRAVQEASPLMPDALTAPIQRPRYIPSLDGLRALSVVLVIVLHTLWAEAWIHPMHEWYLVLGNGGMGVSIFFVISGYLISTLLLREWEKKGTISLKSFYLRRAFRILPPLYVYILFLVVLGATGHLPGMNFREFITAVTFTRNYVPSGLWAMEHLWSICLEEQFYLIWPSVLVFTLLHRKGPGGIRTASRIALAVIVLEPFVRLICFRYVGIARNPGAFHMQADGLMFGALGAMQQGRARFERVYASATRWPWLLPLLIFFFTGALGIRFGNYWNMPIGYTVDGFLILMWLLWLVRNPASLQGRVLNQPAVMWVGRLSYSLYIWQTFFLHHDSKVVFGGSTIWNSFPTNWICIVAAGVFSYYCIEQPSLRVRDVCLRKMKWVEN